MLFRHCEFEKWHWISAQHVEPNRKGKGAKNASKKMLLKSDIHSGSDAYLIVDQIYDVENIPSKAMQHLRLLCQQKVPVACC